MPFPWFVAVFIAKGIANAVWSRSTHTHADPYAQARTGYWPEGETQQAKTATAQTPPPKSPQVKSKIGKELLLQEALAERDSVIRELKAQLDHQSQEYLALLERCQRLEHYIEALTSSRTLEGGPDEYLQ